MHSSVKLSRLGALFALAFVVLMALGFSYSRAAACFGCGYYGATKTVSGTFEVGSTVTYTIVIANSAWFNQQDNVGHEFVDVLPSHMQLVSALPSSGTAVATIGTNTVTWDGKIAYGESVTITITATINPGTEGQTVANQATIYYDSDENTTNESSDVTDDPSTLAFGDATAFTVVGTSSLPQEPVEVVAPPPPATPLCEDHNFNENGVVHSSTADAYGYAVNCRVLYQDGSPTSWLGGELYGAESIGIPGIVELGVQTAVDIFSPPGMSIFNGGAVFCLQGQGTLIWIAASGQPRHAEIIGSYPVPEWEGFTCATLFEPGTLVLVTQNPLEA